MMNNQESYDAHQDFINDLYYISVRELLQMDQDHLVVLIARSQLIYKWLVGIQKLKLALESK